ncbi:MAG: hypothetical protein M3Y54_22400 [Bacteroidota bacterium]|nr:hypothetical protein [Bacteroidota bacterium]
MSADVYTPLGGGSIGKAEAFDIVINRLLIDERPLSVVRQNIFEFMFNLGDLLLKRGDKSIPYGDEFVEGWQEIGALYLALADLEAVAMKPTHLANEAAWLERRRIEAGG